MCIAFGLYIQTQSGLSGVRHDSTSAVGSVWRTIRPIRAYASISDRMFAVGLEWMTVHFDGFDVIKWTIYVNSKINCRRVDYQKRLSTVDLEARYNTYFILPYCRLFRMWT